MVDRRNHKADAITGPQFNQKKDKPPPSYKPIGQILLEKNLITSEQLDEALKTHWERGVILGEVLKEQGLLNEQALNQTLETQNNILSK